MDHAKYKTLATWDDGKTEAETEALSKTEHVLTLKELMDIPYDSELEDRLAARSRTRMEYAKDATTARVWNLGEEGKAETVRIPAKSGEWRKRDKWGIPNGALSAESDPEASRLWRRTGEPWSGLLARGGCGDFDYRRDVGADFSPDLRFGVVGWQKKPKTGKGGPKAMVQEVKVGRDGSVKMPKAWAGKKVRIEVVE